MSTKVATGDVEDQLALVSVVLVDRDLVLAEAGKDRANVADGGVGNLVDLVVGELDALLEVLANGSELVSGSLSLDNGGALLGHGLADLLANLVVHHLYLLKKMRDTIRAAQK